ncbi:MAG: galactose oxidase [Catenulispora sp.]|nr:galactose oxidase [Catenulispora sp.]
MVRRGRLRAPVSFLVAASLGLFAVAQAPDSGAATAAGATAAASAPVNDVTQVCATPKEKDVYRCFAERFDGSSGARGLTAVATAPKGLSPSDLVSAYRLPANGGAGATIAVVDAFDDPNAEADLAVYRQQYGLPALNLGQFRKVDQRGERGNYPAPDEGWSAEISLDLDMVSAVAPKANIILVEADTATSADLGAAVNQAVALGAGYVSNSYGSQYTSTPGSGESIADQQTAQAYYDHPGVAIVASSGDDGYGVAFPAAAPHVTSVGATSLVRDSATARGWSETVWNSRGHAPGSGCSTVQPKPAFQHDGGCAGRTVADVSAVGDPLTGVAVYDSYGAGATGWAVYGGTSASAPIIASAYADAGPIAAGSYPNSYPYAHTADLNDVTSGNDGTCATAYLCTAGPGYDGPTGLGTPNGTAAFSGGPTGTLSGTITDAATGKPLADAKVAVAGVSSAGTVTGPDGTYSMLLAPGTYDVTVSEFGYKNVSTSGVTVTTGTNSTDSAALTPLPQVTVSGTVADASGHGWPLYAAIQVDDGIPGGPFYSDPKTGKYSIRLPENGTYTLHTRSNYEGYTDRDVTVTTKSANQVQNIGLNADVLPEIGKPAGYTQHSDGDTETFPDKKQPAGWSVQTAEGPAWSFAPGLPDYTAGNAGYVGTDTKYAPTDTSLLTPVVTVPASQTPYVSFYSYGAGGTAEVYYSLDGGTTWTLKTSQNATQEFGRPLVLAFPASAAPVALQVKFRYVANTPTSSIGTTWELANVRMGGAWVTPQPGGLVIGNVKDGNTAAPIDGTAVSVDGGPVPAAITAPMPGVAGRTDGFYHFFSPATGRQTVTAAIYQYRTESVKTVLAPDKATVVDFTLHTGRLVTSGPIQATVLPGGSATRDLTLSNTGDAPLTVKLQPFAGSAAGVQVQNTPLQLVPTTPGDRAALAKPMRTAAVGAAGTTASATTTTTTTTASATAATGPSWTSLPDLPVKTLAMVAGVHNGTLYAGLGDDGDTALTHNDFYAYDQTTGAWVRKADAPVGSTGAAGGFIGDKFYAAGGMSLSPDYVLSMMENTEIYDPATDTWSTGAKNPNATLGGGSAILDGKLYVVGGMTLDGPPETTVSVYDPKTDTWTAGPSYPEPITAESCGAIAGKLYCAGGVDVGGLAPTTHGFVFDPAHPGWKPIAGMPTGMAASAYGSADGRLLISGGYVGADADETNQGFAYDPAMDWWTPLPNGPVARIWATGALGFYALGGTRDFGGLATAARLTGYDQPGEVRVPWLSANRSTLTIQPGQHVTVRVVLDARNAGLAGAGADSALYLLETDSPYAVNPLPVTLTVRAR